ncbi:MAG: hypothetical protein M3Z04_14720 [Chloroflexota bacterium]|nr:hypothetical protein [Chloroflexota bacterium]
MTSRTVGDTVKPYSYDTTHKDAPANYNGVSYTYDANGSQVSTSAGQSRTFDPEGRLSSVSDGTTVSAYIYDANGQRLLTSVTAGGTTRCAYRSCAYRHIQPLDYASPAPLLTPMITPPAILV